MKFSLLFLLAPLVAAVPAAVPIVGRNAASSPEPDLQGNVFVCTDANFSGLCVIFHGASGQCVNFSSEVHDLISSFGPDTGQDCFIFIDDNCGGASSGPIRNPGISNLANLPGFNDAISSFKCFFG